MNLPLMAWQRIRKQILTTPEIAVFGDLAIFCDCAECRALFLGTVAIKRAQAELDGRLHTNTAPVEGLFAALQRQKVLGE